MSTICPTVLASEPHAYREQIEKATSLSSRVQIDVMDGEFAPSKSINLIQVWWPEGTNADIHLMYVRPVEHLETLISLRPSLVIFHAEAEGDLVKALLHLQKLGIKAGVALLRETTVDSVRELIEIADHVLIFSGDLGHFGGQADLTQLEKVPVIKAINPTIEIGWDGGANESNARQLATGGVDVINVGSAIQRADDPQTAYDTLIAKLSTT